MSEGGRDRYKVIFLGEDCIGAGRCAEVSKNWSMDIETGLANPGSYFLDENDLEHNTEAAEVCPANNGEGAILILDTETDEVIAPENHSLNLES